MAPIVESSVLARIQKLLRLSNSSNKHEAELAMQRAVEYAARHQIDLRRINTEDDEALAASYEEREIMNIRFSTAHRYVAGILRKYFNVITLIHGKNYTFVGTTEAVDVAVEITQFLVPQFRSAWRDAREDFPGKRGPFYRGMYEALCDKLTESQMAAAENAGVNRSSMEIIVKEDINKLVSWVEENVTQRRNQSRSLKVDETSREAIEAGYDAGSEIELPSTSAKPHVPKMRLGLGA